LFTLEIAIQVLEETKGYETSWRDVITILIQSGMIAKHNNGKMPEQIHNYIKEVPQMPQSELKHDVEKLFTQCMLESTKIQTVDIDEKLQMLRNSHWRSIRDEKEKEGYSSVNSTSPVEKNEKKKIQNDETTNGYVTKAKRNNEKLQRNFK